MDKIKPILEVLKKNLFWIMCLVALLVTVATYFQVSASIAEQQAAREADIQNSFKLADEIRKRGYLDENLAVHPNPSMADGVKRLVEEERSAVRKEWTELHDRQQELLTWPRGLHKSQTAYFKQYRPIELKIAFTPEPVNDTREAYKARGAYRDIVRDELIELAAKIGEVWLPTLTRKRVNQALNESIVKATKDGTRVVLWNETNQQYWEAKFTDFRKPYNLDKQNTPRLIQVLYAQEDIWVLNSILEDIIKATNGDAVANDLAKIKKIDHIFIGHDAQGINGNIDIASSGVARPGVVAPPANVPAMGNLGTGQGIVDPANGRYVNRDFEPLDAKTLRDSFTATNDDIAYLAIAKRIPVRMGLQMDERAVWELLVNCANARLPLEVRQVRINSHSPNERGSLASQFEALNSAAGDSMRGPEVSTGSGEMMIPERAAPRTDTYTVGKESAFKSAYQIPVEVFGIIYLYNPPDKKIVSPGEETAGVAGESSPTG